MSVGLAQVVSEDAQQLIHPDASVAFLSSLFQQISIIAVIGDALFYQMFKQRFNSL